MNLKYLNDCIILSHIPITAIAKEMGISRQTLYLKMKGERDFKISEVYKLCDVLRLTNDEKRLIFLQTKLAKSDNPTTDELLDVPAQNAKEAT